MTYLKFYPLRKTELFNPKYNFTEKISNPHYKTL